MDPEKIHLIGGDPALPANPASLATVVNVADNSLAASEAGYLNTGYGSQSHQHSLRRRQRRRHRHQRGAAAVLVAAALVVVLSVFGVYCLYSKIVGGKGRVANTTKRNLILMISDGFGPASETMARNYYQHIHGKPVDWQSPLDKILVGSSRTRSSDSFVTDSAAGATAFSCALKTYNGAIGVTDERRPCGTVLEAAKQRGMMTGLVVTSRITHATPASFSAHVVDRGMEDLIAQYQVGNYSLGRTVDLMFGGGRCHFLPRAAADSCRRDDLNVWALAQEMGYRVLSTRTEFDRLDPADPRAVPVLGALAPSHLRYEIDRDPREEPSLAEMTAKALEILDAQTRDSSEGFFMMVEGSKIDLAAHSNDAAAHVREIVAYWEAVEVVKRFVDAHPNTLVVSVSDHETGGLTIGRQLDPNRYPEYRWRPDVLAAVKNSTRAIAEYVTSYCGPSDAKYAFVNEIVFPQWLGIADATQDEVEGLAAAKSFARARELVAQAVSKRAELGFTTHGHTGVDVNLYAYGWEAQKFRGNHENVDLGSIFIDLLKLDLDSVTARIAHDNTKQPTPYDPYAVDVLDMHD